MHAYLIVGRDHVDVENKVRNFVEKLGVKPLEFSINKIENVRELGKFLSLTQPENTVILLRDIDNSSPDALNAFLKNLEEPQKNVVFLLTAASENRVLPTILSRCQVIRAGAEKLIVDSEKNDEIQNFLNNSISERFKYLDKIKKRDEAIIFIKDTINIVHDEIKVGEKDYNYLANQIKFLQKTLDALNQNGNVTIHLTNLVLNLNDN